MSKFKNFLTSNYFIALVYAITIVLWWTNLPIVAMIIYLLLLITIIVTNTNRITLVTLIFAAIISFKDTNLEKTAPIITISVVLALPFLLYDIIKTKIDFKNIIFIAMLVFLGANILSLVNLTKETFTWGVLGIGQTFAFVMLFFYISNRNKDGDFSYVAKNAAALGIAIAIEFALYCLKYDGEMGKDIKLGWGMSNSIAMIVTILIPLTYSLYIKNQKNKFPLVVFVIELIVTLLMMSKGAYLALAVMLPIMAIISFIKADNRKTLIYDNFFVFGLLAIAVLAVFQIEPLKEGFVSYFEKMNDRGWLQDNSRLEIYKYALDIFKRFPIFGSGTYTAIPYLVEKGYHAGLIHYHNIFLHSLATLGIVGLGSFLYFLYTSIKSTLVNHSYNLFVFAALVAIVVHGMVDNTWYNPLVMICILTALSVLGRVEKPI